MELVSVSNLSRMVYIRSCSSLVGTGINALPKPLALIAEILPEDICFFIYQWNCFVRVK